MNGMQWFGVVLAVACFGTLLADAILTYRRSRARRQSWSRHVDRALELARRQNDQPRVPSSAWTKP